MTTTEDLNDHHLSPLSALLTLLGTTQIISRSHTYILKRRRIHHKQGLSLQNVNANHCLRQCHCFYSKLNRKYLNFN